MSSQPTIVCKPTRWFLLRAAAIFLMFAVFAVLFYIDGSTGYREKNRIYYIYQAFKPATDEFANLNNDQKITPSAWAEHAKTRSVTFPDDLSILPKDLELPMPWPEILADFDKVKSLQWKKLWLEYSGEMGYPAEPSEQPYDRGKIREQWIAFAVCTLLASVALFFLLRTMRRSITADDDNLTGPNGKPIPYSELKLLDLRKWDTKGIAYVQHDGPTGSGRIRIDGLTFGGFRKDDDEPAEKLMRRIRSKFTGEVIEYTIQDEPKQDTASTNEEPANN